MNAIDGNEVPPKLRQHFFETLLLVPSSVILYLVALCFFPFGTQPVKIPAWGSTLFLFSPFLVIYNIWLLQILVKRENPGWIKVMEVMGHSFVFIAISLDERRIFV